MSEADRLLLDFREAGALDALALHATRLLAERVGERDPEVRLALALALRAPRRGHVALPLERLSPEDLLDDEPEGPLPALPGEGWIERVRASRRLVRGPDERRPAPFVLDRGLLYSARYFELERQLARRLLELNRPTGLGTPDRELARRALDLLFPPSEGIDLQRVAAGLSLLGRLTVLAGGPGMGKTWTVRAVLVLHWLLHRAAYRRGERRTPQPAVALAAPTGKAAARVEQALLQDLDLTLSRLEPLLGPGELDELADFLRSLEARTLHRLLGVRRDQPTRFRHHREHPLPHDLLVLDEASMADLPLMARFLDAVGEHGPSGARTRLLVIGDRDQLASVEAGSVLAELCGPTRPQELLLTPARIGELRRLGALPPRVEADSRTRLRAVDGPPLHDAIVQLNRTYRFSESGGIGAFVRACSQGEPASRVVQALLDADEAEIRLLPPRAGRLPPEALALAVEALRPYLELLHRGPGDPGRAALQLHHRRALELFDGFRVLCAHRRGRLGVAGVAAALHAALKREGLARGEWWLGRPVLVERNDYGVRLASGRRGLYNGDIGLLVRLDDRPVVAFPGPDAPPDDGPVPDDAWLVDYAELPQLPQHTTALALTVHKSQGSEYEHVMVVLPDRPSPVLGRELVYTALTRARKRVTLVAKQEILLDALGHGQERASGLGRALWGDALSAPSPRTG